MQDLGSIQLSVESKWQDKVKKDAAKVKKNYDTSVLYFLSSRRIPEDSFQKISREIFEEYSISVNRYDSQAIATEFIRKNKVGDLLRIFGIEETLKPSSVKGYLGPKNEAIASVLIFGEESKELRGGLYDSLIKAHLVRFPTGIERETLYCQCNRRKSAFKKSPKNDQFTHRPSFRSCLKSLLCS